MRILYVTDFVPSPRARHGGGKSIAHYVQQMHQEGHAVSIVAIARGDEMPLLGDLQPCCEQIVAVPVSPSIARKARRAILTLAKPVEYAFCDSVGLERSVSSVLEHGRYDVVHAVQPHTVRACRRAMRHLSAPPRLVAHAIDVVTKVSYRKMALAKGAGRLAAAKHYLLTSSFEFQDYAGADSIVCHTQSDYEFIRAMTPRRTTIYVSPLWFDAIDAIIDSPDQKPPAQYDLLYVGNSGDIRTQQAVEWFLSAVHPIINASKPGLSFTILGVNDEHMAKWGKKPGVSCVRFQQDVLAYYDTASVCIAPMLTGGGIHLKVLNAFARACPVVMTSTANDGINANHGTEALIADTPFEFASCIGTLLDNPDYAMDISKSALHKIKRQYPPRATLSTLMTAYTGHTDS